MSLDNEQVDFNKLDLTSLSDENIKLLIKDRVLNKELKVLNENKNSVYFVRNSELIRKKITGDLENHFIYKKYTPNEVEVL